MLRAVSRLLLLGASAACSAATLPKDAPFIRGTVATADASRGVLVEAEPGADYESDRAYVRVSGETEIRYRDGTRAGRADLVVGREVSVWITGPVLESYPPQVYGRTIVIEPGRDAALPYRKGRGESGQPAVRAIAALAHGPREPRATSSLSRRSRNQKGSNGGLWACPSASLRVVLRAP